MGVKPSNHVSCAVALANQIGMERIEKRHRAMADYIHSEMMKRGAQSWTSPDPTLRCAIATVTVAPRRTRFVFRRRTILLRKDVDRFLAAFDESGKA